MTNEQLPPVQDPGPADFPPGTTITKGAVTVTAEPVPMHLDEIKDQVRARLDVAVSSLEAKRRQRKALDADIRFLVAEVAEAKRVAKALEPRKPRSKAVKK